MPCFWQKSHSVSFINALSLSVSSPSRGNGSLCRRPVMASTMRVCSRTGMARHSVQPEATSVNTSECMQMPMPLHGLDQRWQQRLQPFTANPVGCFPQNNQCFLHRFQVGAASNLPPLMGAPLGGQQPDCMLPVIPCQLDELIQDQFLTVSIRRLIALADCRRQFSACGQLDLSPHFRPPRCLHLE